MSADRSVSARPSSLVLAEAYGNRVGDGIEATLRVGNVDSETRPASTPDVLAVAGWSVALPPALPGLQCPGSAPQRPA